MTKGGRKDRKRALDGATTMAFFSQQPSTSQPDLLVSEAEGEMMAHNLEKIIAHKKAIEKREATAKAVIKQALDELEKQQQDITPSPGGAQASQPQPESPLLAIPEDSLPIPFTPPAPTMSFATLKTPSSHSWTIGQLCHSSLLETSNLGLLEAARRALQTQIDKFASDDHEISVNLRSTFVAQAVKVEAKMVSLRRAQQRSTSIGVEVERPSTSTFATHQPATSAITLLGRPSTSSSTQSTILPSDFPVDDCGLPAITLEDMHINQLCNPKLANYPDLAMLAQIITYIESQLNTAHIGFARASCALTDIESDEAYGDDIDAEREEEKYKYSNQKIKFNQVIEMLSKQLVRLFFKREELHELDRQIMEDAEKEKDMSQAEIQMAIKNEKVSEQRRVLSSSKGGQS